VSADPKPLAAGLAQARQALADAAARGERREPPPELADGVSQEDVAADMEAMRLQQEERRWQMVCPKRFRNANWDWVKAEHGETVLDQLQGWSAEPDPPNLVMLGPVGTGKSATALLTCKEGQLHRGQGVAFYPTPQLMDELRPGGDETAMARTIAAPRLILDDLGTEKVTDWTAERLGILVNARWMEERPIVATTNLALDQLRESIGERTYSRLVGGALVLQLGGEDRRRRRG
jgi:DNA replication protein DnaC